jgi:MoxR-like ATPase
MNQIEKKIDFWIKNNQNAIFIGKHGVGKTSIVKNAFERHNLNYRYFSASTMDPWVDFVGIPKENTKNKLPEGFEIIKELANISYYLAETWIANNWKLSTDAAEKIIKHISCKNNEVSYIELIRPYSFASGEIEALFFDEFNRSPKKVRNAVMELIQFKSINGFKFPKLRLVWAAINPEDDEETYDVEKLDPAQKDRFHVSIEMPYQPNVDWFRKEYGKRTADAAIQWWNELPEEEKNKISPRRLQYALDAYKNKGDLRDIIPYSSNVSKLYSVLNQGPTVEKLEGLIQDKNDEETKAFLSNENNYSSAIKYILKSDYFQNYFLPLLPKEKIALLISEEEKLIPFIVKNCEKIPCFKQVCEEIIKANTNTKLVKRLRKSFTENQND